MCRPFSLRTFHRRPPRFPIHKASARVAFAITRKLLTRFADVESDSLHIVGNHREETPGNVHGSPGEIRDLFRQIRCRQSWGFRGTAPTHTHISAIIPAPTCITVLRIYIELQRSAIVTCARSCHGIGIIVPCSRTPSAFVPSNVAYQSPPSQKYVNVVMTSLPLPTVELVPLPVVLSPGYS